MAIAQNTKRHLLLKIESCSDPKVDEEGDKDRALTMKVGALFPAD